MPNPPADHWRRLRAQIPAASHLAYLNAGWSGPLPHPVVEAIERRLRHELERGPTTRAVFQEQLDLTLQLRQRIAALVDAHVDEILLTQNTTEGLNLVLNALPWAAGDELVTTCVEHSSGLVPAYALRDRRGVTLRFVETDASDGPGDMAEKFAAAIGPRTKLVLLSHISYSTGQIFPLPEIQSLAQRVGARVLVDGAQAVGQLPLRLHAWAADFYALPAHKWLLGPDGIGALFVRRDHIAALEPIALAGAAAQEIDFSGGGYLPQREALTKCQLTTASAPLVAGMAAAVDFYRRADPAAVWDRIRELAAITAARLAAIDTVHLISPTRREDQSGLVAFRLRGLEGPRIAEFLQAAHGVVCRGVAERDACRLSLHYFNTETEIDRAISGVRAAAQDGIPATFTGARLVATGLAPSS